MPMMEVLKRIINRGAIESEDMEARRRLGLLNIAALLCFFAVSVFIILNIVHHNWVLLINNLVLVLLTTGLTLLYRLKHFNASLVVFAFLFTAYFFVNALFFRNGLDLAIVIMMAVSVLLINSRPARICILFTQVGLFGALLLLQEKEPIIPALPSYRIFTMQILLLVTLACLMEYFKSKQEQYLKALSKANESLRESNRVKEQMLTILSHDFNAPIANISATLMLFDDKAIPQQVLASMAVKLRAQLKTLSMSLEDVLQWSKMQREGEVDQAQLLSLTELLNGLEQILTPALNEKQIQVKNNLPNACSVYACHHHIKLIFRNLLSNAIKFSHQGGTIYVAAKILDGKVAIAITDEGTGIKPTILKSLQQENPNIVSTPGTAKEKGTGLGLMLVREFLSKNNGMLAIESIPDKGSTFTVTLPSQP